MLSVHSRSLIECSKHPFALSTCFNLCIAMLRYVATAKSRKTLIDIHCHHAHRDMAKAISTYQSLEEEQRNSVITLSKLMKCCMKHNESTKAISLYEAFRGEHDDVSHVLYLKACINCKQFDKAKQFLATFTEHLNEHSIEFVTVIIDCHAQTGDMHAAESVFNSTPKQKRDAVLINAMMSGYLKAKQSEKAMKLYEEFDGDHTSVSHLLYIKACTNCKEYEKAEQVIAGMKSMSVEVINTVIDLYGEIGDVEKAMNTFNQIAPNRMNIIAISAMMNCFLKNNRPEMAITLYAQYRDSHHDDLSDTLYLKACIKCKQFGKGREMVDASIATNKHHSIEFMNTVIDFHGHVGNLQDAVNAFCAIPAEKKDTVSTNVMMDACIRNGESKQAMTVYEACDEKQRDQVSMILYLKSCTNAKEWCKGEAIIEQYMHENSSDDHNISLITTMIDFYASTGRFRDALQLFHCTKPSKMDILCFNSMLTHCVKSNRSKEAMDIYETYACNDQHIEFDDISKVLYLKACINEQAFGKAMRFVDEYLNATTASDSQRNLEFMNTVIDFYAHTKNVSEAQKVFDDLVNSGCYDIVAIGNMMSACMKVQEYQRALALFEQHQSIIDSNQMRQNTQKRAIIYSTVLDCYGDLLLPHKADQFLSGLQHKSEYSDICNTVEIHSAVIRMYGKMGEHVKAEAYFHTIDENTLTEDAEGYIYTAMMSCYSKQGDCSKVLQLFHEIKQTKEVKISKLMYVTALKTCSHSGRIDEAKQIYAEIVDPDITVVEVIVDCYARANHLREAEEIFDAFWRQTEREDDAYHSIKMSMLKSIMSAYRIYNDMDVNECLPGFRRGDVAQHSNAEIEACAQCKWMLAAFNERSTVHGQHCMVKDDIGL